MGKTPERRAAPIAVPKMQRIVPLYPPNGEAMPLASIIPAAIQQHFDQIGAKRE
jgi:hypothetical protein